MNVRCEMLPQGQLEAAVQEGATRSQLGASTVGKIIKVRIVWSQSNPPPHPANSSSNGDSRLIVNAVSLKEGRRTPT